MANRPKNAAVAKPSRMSRLMARMARTSARVTRRITNELANGATSPSAITKAMTSNILLRLVMIPRSLPPEQPGRLQRQDHRHRCVQREIGNLGEQRLAEIVRQPHQQCPDRCAAQATHAADDHHRECDRQDLKV